MKSTRKKTWFLILAVLLALTQACTLFSVNIPRTPAVDATVENSQPPSATPSPMVPPTETPTPDAAALCPTPDANSSLFLSRENGFCFLYPLGFSLEPDFQRPEEAFALIGPVEPGTNQERIRVTLSIAYNGDGSTGPKGFWRMLEDLLAILLDAGFGRRDAIVQIRMISNRRSRARCRKWGSISTPTCSTTRCGR